MKKKILVVRNDKLGDFMLAYPSFAMLKLTDSQIKIHALVPEYTSEMAKNCEWVDEVVCDPGKDAGLSGLLALVKILKREKYDAAITLFSTTRIGLALLLAGIPLRIAPATKLAQVFYNKKLTQRRSRSMKPEYEYNCDLIRYFYKLNSVSKVLMGNPPYLKFSRLEMIEAKKKLFGELALDDGASIIMVHPGSGGSANNLSINQYAGLVSGLANQMLAQIVITCGPGEVNLAKQLRVLIEKKGCQAKVYESKNGLTVFSKVIQLADIFISGSTGPLHIAGALNRKTIAFYPRGKVTSALRWQATNESDNRLEFFPNEKFSENDMDSIDIKKVIIDAKQKFDLSEMR